MKHIHVQTQDSLNFFVNFKKNLLNFNCILQQPSAQYTLIDVNIPLMK